MLHRNEAGVSAVPGETDNLPASVWGQASGVDERGGSCGMPYDFFAIFRARCSMTLALLQQRGSYGSGLNPLIAFRTMVE